MIDDESLQFWIQLELNNVAIKRALEAIDNLGVELQCKVTAISGALVTVQFISDTSPWTLPEVTIPKSESPWLRMPTQVGDLGVARPAGPYIGQVSGLGVGNGSLRRLGNLVSLYFVPISNANSPPPNVNAATVQGPEGAIIQTTTGTASSVVTNQSGTTITFGNSTITVENGQISMTAGGKTVTINSSGVTIDGTLFETHTHLPGTYVAGSTAVTGDSGAPA